jgi:hypothetical protein
MLAAGILVTEMPVSLSKLNALALQREPPQLPPFLKASSAKPMASQRVPVSGCAAMGLNELNSSHH